MPVAHFSPWFREKSLCEGLEAHGNSFEWSDIKQNLKALQETVIEENGKRLAVRGQCLGTCGMIFQCVGLAIPPTIKEI
ncbi:MAG: hypothetical protein AB2L11_13155 [Syntrophobacteraceae bacterium]